MQSYSLKDFKNVNAAEFELLADQVGTFVLDQSELCDLLDTAGQEAQETDVYKNLLGIFLRREILGTGKPGIGNA
ncbi:hypothetical protein [Pseudodesulfovibrio senegalensis]|uniref:Uncharacterized protein n=1 Tax=Pseudodesulfovibrio senegalensis TaxID=1721087 RepID=A0A6N6N6N4_9BACT|nr:hypothetical protein [Pseudodesulfovibrio senegalensis]KAB1443563.1 hypothetical protein F8A88_04770 [Pseudodesulfovibrio senegalensis]